MIQEGSPVDLSNEKVTTSEQTSECTLYKRRWFILFLFILYTISNVMQWVLYSVIADVIVEHYGVSYLTVDMTSLIFLLFYIAFSFPGSYILDKMGLRTAVLLGVFGTCIAAWIKLASVSPDKFWIILISQSILGMCNVLVQPVPPKLAGVWFGAKEVSTACSIAILGVQVGIAVGFVVPPMLVNHERKVTIEEGLFEMSLIVAIYTTVVLFLLVIFFPAAPPTPPSLAQLQITNNMENESFNFLQSIKNLVCNRSYMLLLIAYSTNVGLLSGMAILLNQIILKYHPDATKEVGYAGLVVAFASMFGCIVFGIILDKFNRYKETALAAYVLSFAAMIAFTFGIRGSIEMVYLVLAALGFSVVGVVTVGFELGVELTYPEPEGTSGGMLTTSVQVFAIIFTYLYSYLFYTVGDLWANLTMCVILFFGIILIACIKNDMRRQKAQMSTKSPT